MPQQGINFDGAFIGLPGAYYADNVSATAPVLPPVTPPLLFLAYAWGPKPKTPVTFTNPQDLANAMRGSPGSLFVPFLAVPSPSLNGAQLITLIDVSSNTQSAAALLASGGQTIVTLTSALYGPPSNQMSYQVSSGTTAGYAVTLFDNFANVRLSGNNLTVPFQLAYSGAATGALSYTAGSASFVASSPIAGETVTVPLGSGAYSTVSLLIEALNGTSNWLAVGLSSTNGQLPSTSLTAMSGTLAVLGSGGPAYSNVNVYLQDIPFWVNQFASTLASAVVSGSALDTAAWLPATGSVTFFSGATGVPPTNSDYATALNVALAVPGWTVFCDQNTAAVQALMAQHCVTASSTPYGMWRRGFTGSSIGDAISTTITNSRNLDTIQMNYVYPGIYRINTVTGQNQLYGGLYAAACAASMATGNLIAQPLTNQPLFATGVELVNANAPLTNSQLTNLQNNGVMAIYPPRQTGIPTILSDVTTWEDDANAANTSSQQVACRYWLAYSSVNAVQPYVGSIASPQTEVVILNAMKRCLQALIYTGGSSNGVLASVDLTTLQLMYTGENQVAGVTFSCVLVGQNRYITVFATVLPLNFTIVSTG